MNKELISIIVPVYNVEKELDRCVQSLIHQTYERIEIILVDDGSPDSCPKLCDEYAKQDCRIKVIHKQNGGLSEARNVGLNMAKGTYVLYVDSDDYIQLDACENLVKGFIDDVDFVVGACKEIYKDNISYQKHTNIKPETVYNAKEFVIKSIKNFEWYAPAWLNLYKREFLLKNNLFYKVGYLYEDIEMLPRLFLAASKVSYIDYPFYNYVIRENSIMTSMNTPQKVKMTLDIYNEWMMTIHDLVDSEYQRWLYGILIKLYMKDARTKKINGWKIKGMDFGFAMKYALNLREKMKVLYFSITPNLYIR